MARIGSVTPSAITSLQPSRSRSVIAKAVPLYAQQMYFDVLSNAWTIALDGVLVSTVPSKGDLASQIQQFLAIVKVGGVVWIDCSDQYQSACYLCRITDVTGPTLDSTKNGVYIADWSLKALVVLPWGTTLLNPWNRTGGVALRDLNGIGSEVIINPLDQSCNYILNQGSSFIWELIVDNQAPFSTAISTQELDCDGLTEPDGAVATNNPASIGSAFTSIQTDTTNFKEGTGSLNGTVTSPSGSTSYALGYDLGAATPVSLTGYDRLRMWFRCDHASQTQYTVFIGDDAGHTRSWNFSLQGASTWQQVEVMMNEYSADTGLIMSAVEFFGAYVKTASSAPSSMNVWIDDIRVEVGYVSHTEDTSGWTTLDGAPTFTVDQNVVQNSYFAPNNAAIPFGHDIETTQISSLKMSGAASSGALGGYVALPVGAWNLTSPTRYEYLCLWFRSDFGGNVSGSAQIRLGSTTAFSSNFQWTVGSLAANQWYRLVLPLNSPTSTTGSPNLNSIDAISIASTGGATSATTHTWVAEIGFDVGNWVYLECMVPDDVQQNASPTYQAMVVQSWNGSSYVNALGSDPFASTGSAGVTQAPYLLNASLLSAYYSNSNAQNLYSVGGIGQLGLPLLTVNTEDAEVRYTTAYGTNSRFVYALKLPPATSDTGTGNLPSNNLTGFQAMNKARLKFTVLVTDEKTTYTGF